VNINKQKISATLKALEYDFTQFSVAHFVQKIAQSRRRPIVLKRYPFALGLFGLWIPTLSMDCIVVNAQTHPIHQVHIILHEIAHLLLDHPRYSLHHVLPTDTLDQLGITGVEGCMQYQLTRLNPLSPEEQEAEEFVVQVQEKVIAARRLDELTSAGTSIAALLALSNSVVYEG
jgi:hypothetical protein